MDITENILKKKIILNPYYMLHNDIKRVVLTNRKNYNITQDIADDEFTTFIHPIHAMMLSFFKGDKKLEDTLGELSNFFHLSKEKLLGTIQPFIHNEKEIVLEHQGKTFPFPRNVLIENTKNYTPHPYHFTDFEINGNDLDFSTERFYNPLDILFVINTTCVTDCIYCYADKNNIQNCSIPFERLKELVQEARSLKMRGFDISGGEFFLYKNWEGLLTELLNNDFIPYISTKVPLQKQQIDKLKNLDIKHIQISLDSIIAPKLQKVAGVGKEYLEKMLGAIAYINKQGIELTIKPVLTAYNYDLNEIDSFIDTLTKFESIKRISFTPAGNSIYKEEAEFKKFRLTMDQINALDEFLKNKKTQTIGCNLTRDNSFSLANSYFNSPEEKRRKFESRVQCSGNIDAFIILPDGKVTICEELYWDKNFIIGDINKQSIREIWNSPRAKQLFELKQQVLPKDSYCSQCEEFDYCRPKKGVCWKQVLAAYGSDRWYYPDPSCQYAPALEKVIYVE